MNEISKPKIGVYGLTGCAGDQLNILNCENELLELFNIFDVKSFVMVSSAKDESVELDIAFVEGSVSTAKDLEELQKIRAKTKILVAIGHCAIFGGVQSMFMEDGSWEQRYRKIYGDCNAVTLSQPQPPQPLSKYVKVDVVLPGCPIEKKPFLKMAGLLYKGVIPKNPDYPVCAECCWREIECLLLKGEVCLGPLTSAGCAAICPSLNVPCIGCWGPIDQENMTSEAYLLLDKGYFIDQIIKKLSIFGGTQRIDKLKNILLIMKQEKGL